jgi:hypothetical protein
MKKYLLNAFAFLMAIVFVSYVKQPAKSWKNENRFPDVFLIYQQALGYQGSLGSYTQQQMPPVSCSGNNKLCWFKADDLNFDGVVDYMEFSMTFHYLDNNCNGSLDDEAETSYILEKKF